MADLTPNLHFLHPLEGAEEVRFPPDEQAVLDDVNNRVAAKASLEELVDFLFRAVQELYPCDRIGLAFIEDDGRRLVSHLSKARYSPMLLKEGYGEDLQGSSLRSVIDSGSSRIIYDLKRYEDEHPRSASTRLLVREGVRSSMSCPLMVEERDGSERAIGVLFLSTCQAKAFTPYHALIWRAVATRISQAVEKVWRIEELTRANQAYNEILAFVSHELKNPVASMITDARVLADGYLGDVTETQRRKLERLISKGNYLLDLVREYLDLASMEGGSLTLRPASVQFIDEVIEPAFEIIQAQCQERHMQCQRHYPEHPKAVRCDGGLMKIVLVNLLGNAVKYGKEGGLIRVFFEQSPDHFSVTVWNEGPGWPPEEQHRLFRKFSRLENPELKNKKGTGVGLYTAWRIAHLHGGRMEASSLHAQWAQFTLHVPQPLT